MTNTFQRSIILNECVAICGMHGRREITQFLTRLRLLLYAYKVNVGNWSRRIDSIHSGMSRETYSMSMRPVLSFALFLIDRSSSKGTIARGEDRITVLIACSAAGEKHPLLVIGKSAKPRAFKRYPTESVGITCRHNRKAWMTTYIFTEWLNNVNNKVRKVYKHK